MVDVNDENCGPFGDAKKINWNTRPCRLGRAGRCWDGSGSGHARELRTARVSRRASVAGPKPRIRPRIDRTRAVRSKFKTRLFDAEAAFQKPRVGGRKIGGGAPRTLADDARIVQGLTARSIAIAAPSITPGDAIGGVGSNDESRTRDARSTGGAGKRHVHHSPRRISESHWGVGTDTHRFTARARSGARIAARVATADIVVDAVWCKPAGHRARGRQARGCSGVSSPRVVP